MRGKTSGSLDLPPIRHLVEPGRQKTKSREFTGSARAICPCRSNKVRYWFRGGTQSHSASALSAMAGRFGTASGAPPCIAVRGGISAAHVAGKVRKLKLNDRAILCMLVSPKRRKALRDAGKRQVGRRVYPPMTVTSRSSRRPPLAAPCSKKCIREFESRDNF